MQDDDFFDFGEIDDELLETYGLKGPKKRTKYIHTSSEEKKVTKETLHEALVEGWTKVLDAFLECKGDKEAEILIINSITQVGGILIFPANSAKEPDNWIFQVNVDLYCWAEDYDNLPYYEEDTEENLEIEEQAYEKMIAAQKAALIKAIEDKRLKESYLKLCKNPQFAIYWVDEEFVYVRDQMEYLWGNKPKPRRFDSGKELMSYIFRKSSLSGHHSMRFHEDKLIAFRWEGRNFDDSYVRILKEHPGVTELLKDLQKIYLSATGITPSGIDEFKKLFPNVTFIISGWEESLDSAPWSEDAKNVSN